MPIMTSQFRSLARHLHTQGRIDSAKLAAFEKSLKREERAWLLFGICIGAVLLGVIVHAITR